ncbi:MAG: protein translocase subunit SecF [Myxococcota bacterium]
MQIIRPDTRIDFVKQAGFCTVVSLVLVIASIGVMVVRGFNFGIDFVGGTVIQVSVPEEAGPVDEGTIRAAASEAGFPGAVIVRLGPEADRSFRLNLKLSEEQRRDLSIEVINGLSKSLGTDVVPQRIESIGPRVGGEQTVRGIWALVASWGLILLYIWFRFDLRYAPGAVAALIHDVIITAGVFVALGWEFNLQVLAALLVVIGYSLNDTIVVYDRIRENITLRGATHLEDVVNQSINQTLSRTLLTSATTLAVVAAILILGGPVLRNFAAALLLGVTIGTYSTIYVASSLLIFLERRYAGLAGAASRRAES